MLRQPYLHALETFFSERHGARVHDKQMMPILIKGFQTFYFIPCDMQSDLDDHMLYP